MTTKELPHKQLLPIAGTLALCLMLAQSGLLIQPAVAPTSYDVTILDFSFDPQVRCAEKRDKVVWTNNDPVIHTLWFVFAENGSTYLISDPIPPGESWSHNFTEPCELLCYDFKRLWITGKLRIYTVFGDVDGNGKVNSDDFLIFGLSFGSIPTSGNWKAECDFDGSGKVDSDDFLIFGLHFGMIDP